MFRAPTPSATEQVELSILTRKPYWLELMGGDLLHFLRHPACVSRGRCSLELDQYLTLFDGFTRLHPDGLHHG